MGRLQETRKTAGARPEFLNEQGMIFGAAYSSRAVVPDGTAPPVIANPVTDYLPSACPGGRAPHVWLQGDDGERLSTIDLFGNGFVLLTGSRGKAWSGAAHALAGEAAPAIKTLTIDDKPWHQAYGVEPTGAVLVRPDGHVGWRSRAAADNPVAILSAVIGEIEGRLTLASTSSLGHRNSEHLPPFESPAK
jgi:putative polyketide hydroxylase